MRPLTTCSGRRPRRLALPLQQYTQTYQNSVGIERAGRRRYGPSDPVAAAEYGYELPPDTAERPRGPDLSPAGIAVLTGRKAVHPRAEKAPSNRQGKKIPEGGCQQDGMLTNSLSSDHDHPADLQAVPPPEQKGLRMGVNRDLGQLFLLLAAVCPVVGAVGIANSTSWPSWNAPARQDRANVLGARSRHILAQFLDATGRTCPKKASARAFTAS